MSVKITSLQAENIKRIRAIQLTPAPSGLTILGGGNNQGKTSVLDAIAWALGGDRFRPHAAAREGALVPPHLRIELSNGIVVERKGKNSALTVTDPSGRRCGQQLLNSFVEELALDLPRFMEASDREKADILLKIIGIGGPLAALDRQIRQQYDQRTAIGQIAAQKKHYAEELTEYPEAPDRPVSASELIRRQQAILARNGENQRLRDRAVNLEAALEGQRQRVEFLAQQLAGEQEKLEGLQQQLETARRSAAGLQDESTAALEQSLREIEETNRRVRANLDKARARQEAEDYAAQYQDLTDGIEALRRRRLELLEGADLPLPGLSVEEGVLTYQGRTWKDLSGSDQLRVAAAIVRRLNPECGFVLLDKLEQMDLDTLARFGAWLEAEGLQAIATRVSTGQECQIIIEDGLALGQDFGAEADKLPVPAWKKGAF